MLNWIRQRWTRRNRQIFHYWDGRRNRKADPLAVLESLRTRKDFDLERDPVLAGEGESDAIAATVRAVRESFGVPAWSEESWGLTGGESIALLTEFFTYLESVKKKLDGQPMPQFPTEPPHSEPSITKPPSDSTSTATVPN